MSLSHGEMNSLAMLYERYGQILYSVAFQMLRDAQSASEITEEVFIHFWKNRPKLESTPGNRFGKLTQLTRTLALQRIHGSSSEQPKLRTSQWENPDYFGKTSLEDPMEKVSAKDRAIRVRAGLDALPVGRRELLRALLFDGEKGSQSASRLGKSREAVGQECCEALNALRSQWGAWIRG